MSVSSIPCFPHPGERRDPWQIWAPAFAGVAGWRRGWGKSAMLAVILAAAGFAPAALADEEPKRGGILNYMIPADAPPSLDGHREATYATVHSAAPFYSVLIRLNPEDPSST